MKIQKILLLSVAVLLAWLILSSCTSSVNSDLNQEPNDSASLPENVYSSLIGLLESEIEQLRKEQKEAELEYEKKLQTLESLLESQNTSTPPSDTTAEERSPFLYTVKDGKAEITGYIGNYSVLVIPVELDGYPVTSIQDSAFSGDVKLTSVSLPQKLEKIGWFAFSGCTSLKSITVPSSVCEIGYDAFAYCTKLTLYCSADSYAEKYAESYGISCVIN